jgi:hypothetical protein
MIVVAKPRGRLPALDPAAFANPALRAELERFNIRTFDDLLMHRIGGRSVLGPYYANFGVRPNSDFVPVLDLNAAFARFLRQQVDDMPRLMEAPIPVLSLFERPPLQQPEPDRLSAGAHMGLRRFVLARQARTADAYLRTGEPTTLDALPPSLSSDLVLIRAALIDCRIQVPAHALMHATVHLASAVDSHLSRARREALWKGLSTSACRGAIAARTWLALHRAIAAEDGAAVAAAAGNLLKGDLSPDLVPYALAAQMTGMLLRNDGPAALATFQEHRSMLTLGQAVWDPVFRLLVGQASRM